PRRPRKLATRCRLAGSNAGRVVRSNGVMMGYDGRLTLGCNGYTVAVLDVDFRNLLNADPIGSALCGGNALEAVARARFAFDAGVKFASHYPAPCANAIQVIGNLEEQILIRAARVTATPCWPRFLRDRVIERNAGGMLWTLRLCRTHLHGTGRKMPGIDFRRF